jgi:hypothetical protein
VVKLANCTWPPAIFQLRLGGFATVLEAIRQGAAYVNIHTNAHLGGEIRGQLSHDERREH